ncbi:MAG TPA: hypothetical protein VHE35_00510 [Kofleriaceae bacterium]|nr:hypothetical protein [Kofleriaceae bacterium]
MPPALRRRLALGPRVVALLVTIAALLAAPLALRAAPIPCCCAHPARCQCPEHQRGHDGPTSIRRCLQPDTPAAPQVSAPAVVPAAVVIVAPAATTPAPVTALPAPHDSPELERPAAPS